MALYEKVDGTWDDIEFDVENSEPLDMPAFALGYCRSVFLLRRLEYCLFKILRLISFTDFKRNLG
ncbi:MAG: hypothetical protein GW938_07095 [Leptospira sp.]|nr:hypothetical protein [Leptospira sp.]NCS93952.1 hypothetical protein [Leptospira sp.]